MSDNLKEIVVGTLMQVASQTINKDTIYEITDYPVGGITNLQMGYALNPAYNAFFRAGETFMCVDSGTYKRNCIYKFTGTAWELLLDASLVVGDDDAATSIAITAVGNEDKSYSAENISSVTVTIPSTFKHGDSFGLNFKTGNTAPTMSVINHTSPRIDFKYIVYGSASNSYTPKANGNISMVFINNGLNVLCYVNEV